MERSSITHWRKRVGDKFLEKLVQESLHSAFRLGALETKAIISLGKLAKKEGIELH